MAEEAVRFEVVRLEKGEGVGVPPRTVQLRPTKMFVLPEGSIEDKPSLVFVHSVGDGTPVVVAQISLKMLISSLDDRSAEMFQEAIFDRSRKKQAWKASESEANG